MDADCLHLGVLHCDVRIGMRYWVGVRILYRIRCMSVFG